jgi:hypothetical protein
LNSPGLGEYPLKDDFQPPFRFGWIFTIFVCPDLGSSNNVPAFAPAAIYAETACDLSFASRKTFACISA